MFCHVVVVCLQLISIKFQNQGYYTCPLNRWYCSLMYLHIIRFAAPKPFILLLLLLLYWRFIPLFRQPLFRQLLFRQNGSQKGAIKQVFQTRFKCGNLALWLCPVELQPVRKRVDKVQGPRRFYGPCVDLFIMFL